MSPKLAILGKIKLVTLLELIVDGFLLALFCLQALLAGCFLIFGTVPIPSTWANRLLDSYGPEDLSFVAESYDVSAKGLVKIRGLQIFDTSIDSPLIEAVYTEIQLRLKPYPPFIIAEDIVLTNGAAYLPAIYAPSGERTVALEDVSFELLLQPGRLNIQSFAAIHQSVFVRGTIDLPLPKPADEAPTVKKPRTEMLKEYFSFIGNAIKQRQKYNVMQRPTLLVKAYSGENESTKIDLRLSSRELKHQEFNGRNFQVETELEYAEGRFGASLPLHTSARSIEIPRFNLSLQEVDGQLEPDQWNRLLGGDLPIFSLSAASLRDEQFEFEAPLLNLDLTQYPFVSFNGSTSGLDGAVQASGKIDLTTKSGQVAMSGNVDLLTMIPSEVAEKLPAITCVSPPHYQLSLDLNENYEIASADIAMQAREFTIGDLHFDTLAASGNMRGSNIDFNEISVERGKQRADLGLFYNHQSKDYKIALNASLVPTDYNSLLPGWWASIFKDFDFIDQTTGIGNFIIYGNGNSRVSDLVYGTATAQKMTYRGVLIDSGEIRVRGRKRYYEVDLRDIASDRGTSEGRLQFTSRNDGKRGPVSVRYEFKAALPIDSAVKLLGPGTTSEIVRSFKTNSLPKIEIKGAHFGKNYPEYSELSFFDLSGYTDKPLSFRNTPLDHLDFELYGRATGQFLRNTRFGYADGEGQLEADLLADNSANFKLSLIDADKAQSIRDLPQLDAVEDDLILEVVTLPENPKRESARLDLNVEMQGPLGDPYLFSGYGDLEIRDPKLGSVPLLGPLSKLLQNTWMNFTSLNLNQLKMSFTLSDNLIVFDDFEILGPQTRVTGAGTMKAKEQELDMRINVAPFGNRVPKDSTLRKVTGLVNPIPKLLEFKLTGTLEKQRWRSLYDPRNIIPGL
ncbi:MAG: AsmA-like C-terminal region-containing protein [Verrucomicrobiota bacterium]